MRSWRQAHDEHARCRVAESRNGLTPVLPIAIRAPLLPRDLLAVSDQPRAAGGSDHIAGEDSKPRHAASTPHRRDVFLPETWVTAWAPHCRSQQTSNSASLRFLFRDEPNGSEPKGRSHRLTLLSFCL